MKESFCIALLEAGLFVVSTNVGGVPEVLPPSMIKFAEPRALALVNAVAEAVSVCRRAVPSEFHSWIREMYSWHDVALRTERVYDDVIGEASGSDLSSTGFPSLGARLVR